MCRKKASRWCSNIDINKDFPQTRQLSFNSCVMIHEHSSSQYVSIVSIRLDWKWKCTVLLCSALQCARLPESAGDPPSYWRGRSSGDPTRPGQSQNKTNKNPLGSCLEPVEMIYLSHTVRHFNTNFLQLDIIAECEGEVRVWGGWWPGPAILANIPLCSLLRLLRPHQTN